MSKTNKCSNCKPVPNGYVVVNDVKNPVCHVCGKDLLKNKMKSKTNKLRKEFEEWIGGYAEADIIGNGKWIWEWIETAIQSEKEKWKQEALKAIDEIDDSSIEVKQGDSYLKKGTVGTSGIVGKVTITTSNVKEKCKKVIIEL